MLETPSIQHYHIMLYGKKVIGADNQQERSRSNGKSSETKRQTPNELEKIEFHLHGDMQPLGEWVRYKEKYIEQDD